MLINKTMYYTMLNLPDIKFGELDIIKGKKTVDTIWWSYKVAKRVCLPDGREVDEIRYERWNFNDTIIKKFIKDNIPEIPDNYGDIGFQVVSNDHNDSIGARMSPHIDGYRGNYVLQFVLDTGGTDVATVWWHDPSKEIYREQLKSTKFYFNDNQSFIELDRVVLKPGSWSIIRANVLHSVDYVTTARKMITVGFRAEHDFLEHISKKYS